MDIVFKQEKKIRTPDYFACRATKPVVKRGMLIVRTPKTKRALYVNNNGKPNSVIIPDMLHCHAYYKVTAQDGTEGYYAGGIYNNCYQVFFIKEDFDIIERPEVYIPDTDQGNNGFVCFMPHTEDFTKRDSAEDLAKIQMNFWYSANHDLSRPELHWNRYSDNKYNEWYGYVHRWSQGRADYFENPCPPLKLWDAIDTTNQHTNSMGMLPHVPVSDCFIQEDYIFGWKNVVEG